MQTLMMLMTVYQSQLIDFEQFCEDFLGVCGKTGRNLRALNRFPVPVTDRGKVDLRDVAEYVDRSRAAARSRKL
jgi:hypothetical protein